MHRGQGPSNGHARIELENDGLEHLYCLNAANGELLSVEFQFYDINELPEVLRIWRSVKHDKEEPDGKR